MRGVQSLMSFHSRRKCRKTGRAPQTPFEHTALPTDIKHQMEEKIIPSTRRPDGTWRKEIRVRAGYTPQDEIGAFETTASRMKAGKKTIPGYHPKALSETKPHTKKNSAQKNVSSVTFSECEKKPKNSADDEVLSTQISDLNINRESGENSEDQSKKLRKFRKKLREINELEVKLDAGLINSTDEIQNKIAQKEFLEMEISSLEAILT